MGGVVYVRLSAVRTCGALLRREVKGGAAARQARPDVLLRPRGWVCVARERVYGAQLALGVGWTAVLACVPGLGERMHGRLAVAVGLLGRP